MTSCIDHSSHPNDIRPGRLKDSMTLCHPGDTGPYHKSYRWHTAISINHPDEIQPWPDPFGWLRIWIMLYHPDGIGQHRKFSRWHPVLTISHQDKIRPWANSSRWLRVWITLCHLDDRVWWAKVIHPVTHPDDLLQLGCQGFVTLYIAVIIVTVRALLFCCC